MALGWALSNDRRPYKRRRGHTDIDGGRPHGGQGRDGVKLPHAKRRQSHQRPEEAGRVLPRVCGREHDLAVTP